MIKQIYYYLKIRSRIKEEIKNRMPKFGKISIRFGLILIVDNKDDTQHITYQIGRSDYYQKVDIDNDTERILDSFYKINDKELYKDYEDNKKLNERNDKIKDILDDL